MLIKINKGYLIEQKVNDAKYVFMQFRRFDKMQGGMKTSREVTLNDNIFLYIKI